MKMSAEADAARPPSAAPRWLTPVRVAQLALVLGAALWSHLSFMVPIGILDARAGAELEGPSALALPPTLLLGLLLARRLLQRGRARSTVLESTLAGGLNGSLLCTALMVSLHTRAPLRELWILPPAAIWGCVWGCLYGLTFSAVVSTARAVRGRPCHDAAARVLRVAGACLALLGALSLLAARSWPFLISGGLVALAGLLCSTLVAVHYKRTARWLDLVYQGRASGWAIIPEQDLALEAPPPPLVSGALMLLDGVLVHTPASGLPYREPGGAPVARCPQAPEAGLALAQRSATTAAGWLAMQSVAVALALSVLALR